MNQFEREKKKRNLHVSETVFDSFGYLFLKIKIKINKSEFIYSI